MVFADKERVGKVDLWGRTRSLSLGEVKSAERFSTQNRYASAKHLVFVGPDGRKVFEVTGPAWDFDRLDALCKAAKIHLGGSYHETVSAYRMNRRVPGMTSWGRQVLIGLAFIAFLAVFVILIVGPQQR